MDICTELRRKDGRGSIFVHAVPLLTARAGSASKAPQGNERGRGRQAGKQAGQPGSWPGRQRNRQANRQAVKQAGQPGSQAGSRPARQPRSQPAGRPAGQPARTTSATCWWTPRTWTPRKVRASVPIDVNIMGNHLSNITCLTHVFKSGE